MAAALELAPRSRHGRPALDGPDAHGAVEQPSLSHHFERRVVTHVFAGFEAQRSRTGRLRAVSAGHRSGRRPEYDAEAREAMATFTSLSPSTGALVNRTLGAA